MDSAERDFVAVPGKEDDDSDETVAPFHDGQVMVGEGGELFSRRDLPGRGRVAGDRAVTDEGTDPVE